MEKCTDDIVCGAEHHQLDVEQASSFLAKHGRASHWTQARKSDRSVAGSHGSTFITSSKRANATPLGDGTMGSFYWPDADDRVDWTAVFIRLQGVTVAIVPLYLTHGIGLAGEMLLKLGQVSVFLNAIACP